MTNEDGERNYCPTHDTIDNSIEEQMAGLASNMGQKKYRHYHVMKLANVTTKN